jgi:hypothetical protein
VSTSLTAWELEGRTVHSSDGEKLGTVDDVLVDDRGVAQYLEVRSGWFGTRRHAVPAAGVISTDEGGLILAYSAAELRAAPVLDEHEDLDYDREQTLGAHFGAEVRAWDDARDWWLTGEDLSRGPTPQTRHTDDDIAKGDPGVDDLRDTTQGPTPETRRTMRATEDAPAAAGQPGSDPNTRGDVGGNQDLDPRTPGAAGPRRIRLRRDRTAA